MNLERLQSLCITVMEGEQLLDFAKFTVGRKHIVYPSVVEDTRRRYAVYRSNRHVSGYRLGRRHCSSFAA